MLFLFCIFVPLVFFGVKIEHPRTSISLSIGPLLRQLFILPVHTFNISLIRKTEIVIVANDDMFVHDHAHHLAGKNQLTGNGNVF